MPALAKLLTLASLQGIADTLSGEGIRFESFEMKSNSKGNVLNIDEASSNRSSNINFIGWIRRIKEKLLVYEEL